ncbi:MAG: DUF4189 domain-containing protein [Alphaproteobacteria bacterium]|nr:DUF4189 domain-containing protein [Alphaproteobacteria bacterium]
MKKRMAALVVTLGMAFAVSNAFAAGAIAVADEEGLKASEVGYGIGSGSTRDEAGEDALRVCRKHGNSGCKVAVRYDTCGAYAGSKEKFGIGWGSSEEDAKSKALDDCGSEHCRIVVSDCQ